MRKRESIKSQNILHHNDEYNWNFCKTPCICFPALPPSLFELEAISGVSGVVAPATLHSVGVALPYLRLTHTHTHTHFHTHNTCMYIQQGRGGRGEVAWNLSRLPVPISRIVNDSFCIHGQSKYLLQHTLATIFLMRIRTYYISYTSLIINCNPLYKWL